MGGKSTTTSSPWSHAIPYIDSALRGISQLYSINPATGYYPGYDPTSPAAKAPNYFTAAPAKKIMGVPKILGPAGYEGYQDTGALYGPRNPTAFQWWADQGSPGQMGPKAPPYYSTPGLFSPFVPSIPSGTGK